MRVPAILDGLRPANERTARRTGGAYLGIVGAGLFAEFAVRMSLVTPDDPAATARAIADSQALFVSGVGADVAMIGLDIAVGIGLFRLLRHVDERLAVIATVSRFVQAAVLTVNLINPVRALGFARTAADGTVGSAGQALAAMETHALVYDIGLIAFAVSCLAVARLLSRSGETPKLLPRGMAATGVVYLVGSLAALFAPGVSSVIDPLYGIAIVVEPAFAIWLIARGARLAHQSVDAPVAVHA